MKKNKLFYILVIILFCLNNSTLNATINYNNAKYNQTNTISSGPRFAVISDIHVGGDNWSTKVPIALKNLTQKEKLDAIFICGDLTNGGLSSQYDDLKKLLNNQEILPANLPVYIMMGNHDNYGDPTAVLYKQLGQPLHQYIDIKGYPFITISTRGVLNSGNTTHDEEAYLFLAEKVSDAAKNYPGKPIFIFAHFPPENTMYGSEEWGNPRFYDILSKYPQVVIFSGHTHYPLCDPRSIHQRTFTAINDGSTAKCFIDSQSVDEGQSPTGSDKVTEGVIVNVDDKTNVTIERWNTAINKEILPKWYLLSPHDGSQFIYGDNRTGGEKPFFEQDASVNISNISDIGCKVTFTQAKDDENVFRYRIELIQNDKIISTKHISSRFYLLNEMPKQLSIDFEGIPENIDSKVRVIAIDSYNNESFPLESSIFKIPPFIPSSIPDCPLADLLDIQFNLNGSAIDISENGLSIEKGKEVPEVYLNKNYEKNEAFFTAEEANTNCYYKVLYENISNIENAYQNEFSYEIFYSPSNNKYSASMSSQGNGGAGIMQNDNNKFVWYIYAGGKYHELTSNTKFEIGKYYHIIATYNKKDNLIKMYINGKLDCSMKVTGKFSLPNPKARWIAIGGDSSTDTWAQYGLTGKIIVARMYSKAINKNEAYWLYQSIVRKKSIIVWNAEKYLTLKGVGYPKEMSKVRLDLEKELKEFTTSQETKLRTALNEFVNSSDIQLPESGKSYIFTNIHKDGSRYYLSYNNEEMAWVDNKSLATTFICKEKDNNFIFVNTLGKYLIWFGNEGYNEDKGWLNYYDPSYCNLLLKKIEKGNPNTISVANNSELLGYMCLSGHYNSERIRYFTVDKNGQKSWSGSPYFNDSYSSALILEEASYNNKLEFNTITDIPEIKYISTFSAPFSTSIPQGVTAYYATIDSEDSNIINTHLIPYKDVIPANEGVILISNIDTTYIMQPALEEKDNIFDNILKNTSFEHKIVKEDNIYKFNSKKIMFTKANQGDTIQSNSIYLQLNNPFNNIYLKINGVITKITSIDYPSEHKQLMYDIVGRQIQKHPKKGIYIKGGKKIYIK